MTFATSGAPLAMLHLGLGSFHRAHQAVYMHRLLEAGETGWRLAAGNIRADMQDTVAALRAQGGAYTLETVTPAGERSYTRITSISSVVPWDAELSGLVAQGADLATRIISFTVTEAGYYLDAANRLDPHAPDIETDLAAARAGRAGGTIYGALSAILRERMARGAGGVTLLNCDNLRHNGDRSRAGLLQFIELAGDARLAAWVRAHTASPNAMVDRITPRPTPEVARRVKAATGQDDPAALMAESFIQWVIEDRFIDGRPPWEKVGVEMVRSVDAHEEAKIRLLNATHSCIAWAGTLAGYGYIHEGTQDARIRRIAYDYATRDAIPVLEPSPIDLGRYRDVVLDRFANPALRDTNQRVAMDGFSKIPGFVAPTVRERLARGESIDAVAMLPALFLACLQRWHQGTLPYAYEDQAMDPQVAHAICAAADPVQALASDASLWGAEAGHPQLTAALRGAAARVTDFQKEYA
jgi:D-arabinitol 4-dehydrogenase